MKLAHIIAAVVTLCLSVGANAQALTIAGSTTLQKRLLEPGAASLRTATALDLTVDGVGTGKGMLALFDGKVSVAAASESLQEAVASAMKAARDLKRSVNDMKIPLNLQFHELARDNVVVIVNKDNPIAALTAAQLKSIHTGKVRNWSEVGGPNLPIVVVTSHAGSATRAVFQRLMMDNAEYVIDAIKVSSTREELDEVSNAKGGIGAVSEGFFKMTPGKTRTITAPALGRPLALVTIGAPRPEVVQLIAFYRSPAGQQWLR